MLIYVKNIKKKKLFTDGRTDRRTDRRTTQNYSSEPHKIQKKIVKIIFLIYVNFMLIYVKILK